MTAREFFESIRDEVNEVAETQELLERLRSRETLRAQSYAEHVGGGEVTDGLDAINERIDFEGRLKHRVDESCAAVDEACRILYGRSNNGGLAKLKGNRYADAVCMAYLQAMPWDDVADVMACSRQWCQELCRASFKTIDAYGFAWLKNF